VGYFSKNAARGAVNGVSVVENMMTSEATTLSARSSKKIFAPGWGFQWKMTVSFATF
jgi:hypothetical protein